MSEEQGNVQDLNLDNVDLDDVDISDDELENLDLSNFGEVDDTIEQPHIKVATKQFKDFLKVAKQVASTSGRDVVSKSVCLQADGDVLICRSTDFDVYLEQKIELLNVENILQEPVIVPIDILMKLTKAVAVNTVIFKDGDLYKIKLVGGDIPIETYNVDASKFIFSDKVKKDAIVTASDLYLTMKDFNGVVTSAVSPTERRIICESDKACVNYMWMLIDNNRPFSDMDLKVKDINVLKVLTTGLEGDLTVLSTVDSKVPRKVIQGDKFKYAFLVSDVKISSSLKANMSEVLTEDGVFIDFLQFYKMIELASDLPYSIGKVGLNYNEDGVVLSIKTKKGKDSIFNISGSVNGSPKALKKELVLQAKLLKILLRCFANKTSIKLSITSKGLGVSADTYDSVIYSESK